MTEKVVDKIIYLVLPFVIVLFCVWVATFMDNHFFGK